MKSKERTDKRTETHACDLISRQAALNIRFNDAINEDGVLYVPLRDFTSGLKALPTADVVEVVRCKDCKFTRYGGDERNGILYFCSQDCKAKKSSDFCSYGERADK